MKAEKPEQGKHNFNFADGSFRNVAELETVFIGKGVYLPGWRWSKDVGAQTGKKSERHIGYILEGSFGVIDSNGTEAILKAGDAFEIGPDHDGWVIGDKPCIALDFQYK